MSRLLLEKDERNVWKHGEGMRVSRWYVRIQVKYQSRYPSYLQTAMNQSINQSIDKFESSPENHDSSHFTVFVRCGFFMLYAVLRDWKVRPSNSRSVCWMRWDVMRTNVKRNQVTEERNLERVWNEANDGRKGKKRKKVEERLVV